MFATRDGRVDETRRLLQLLAHGEGGDLEWPPAAAWDWRNFAEACDTHQLVPFIYCRLQGLAEAAVPAGLLEHLRTRFHEICARNYELAKKLVDLASMLQTEGIPVLAYKGPSLAMAVYGGLALRHYNDLDLVIRKEQLVRAVHLMTGWGFQMTHTWGRPELTPYMCRPENPRHVAQAKEIPFCAADSTYYVDLHWQLGDRFWLSLSPDVEKLWERAVWQDLPQGSVSTLCREDLFLALCAHGTRHRWICLKWLLDIAELLRKAATLDWARIEEMARIRPGAGVSASVAVLLARDLLEVPVPVEAGKILPATSRTLALAAAIREEFLLRGESSGKEHATLLALEARPVERMKYRALLILRYPDSLFREIFVRISPKDRALTRLPQRLQFLYHVIRPLRLVVKHCMRVARTPWSTAG
jgi:hypothetical protein